MTRRGEKRGGECTKERSDYRRGADGLTVICIVLYGPYMEMACVNAATVATCIDLT